MSKVLSYQSTDLSDALRSLFENHSPILVEVRFPNMATSSDWYLFEDEEELEELLRQIGQGAEIYLNSVWDLKSVKEPVQIVK